MRPDRRGGGGGDGCSANVHKVEQPFGQKLTDVVRVLARRGVNVFLPGQLVAQVSATVAISSVIARAMSNAIKRRRTPSRRGREECLAAVVGNQPVWHTTVLGRGRQVE